MEKGIVQANVTWDANEIEVCQILLEFAVSFPESEPSHNCSEVDWAVQRKRSRTLKCNADRIEVSNALLQPATSSFKPEPEKTRFRVDWGIKRKRSKRSPQFVENKAADPGTSLSSPTKSQENMKRKRDSRDMKDECDNAEAFNLGFKARKQDNIMGPCGILDQNVRFGLLGSNLDLRVAQDLGMYRAMAAEAGQRRFEICKAKKSITGCKSRMFKICRAKNSINGYTPRYVVPL